MIQYGEKDSVPTIGQILHYHPDEFTRLAAICVEVYPVTRDNGHQIERPNVDLQICKAGKWFFEKDVPTYNDTGIAGSWAFPNEMLVKQKDEEIDDEEILGSNNNCHVQ